MRLARTLATALLQRVGVSKTAGADTAEGLAQRLFPLPLPATHVLHLLDMSLNVVRTIACDERPMMWSARFASPVFVEAAELEIAGGTVMQEVLLWRPLYSTAPAQRLTGHKARLRHGTR